jgi:hypothetical protein
MLPVELPRGWQEGSFFCAAGRRRAVFGGNNGGVKTVVGKVHRRSSNSVSNKGHGVCYPQCLSAPVGCHLRRKLLNFVLVSGISARCPAGL